MNALAPGSWDVQLAWTACECCDACRCTSPSQSVAVTVGPLVPGTNVVTAYGAPCTIVASLPSFCTPADVGEFRAPFDLIEGQAFSATLTSGFTTGCACTPRVDVVSAGVAYELALEVCDCCVDCECVDSGYQSSVVLDPPSLGTHTLIFPHGAGQLEVHERSQCSGIDATRLEIVAPDDGVIVTGPRLHWAHVYGEQALCCAVPAPVVERSDPSPRTIALSLLSCVVDPCDCVPSERTPTDAWFSLEELTSGEYTVTLGSLAQRVVVP